MKNVLLLLCAFLGLSGCHAAQDGDTIDNSTVSVFDVRRFMGKWYEIARYDHRFEKGMTHVRCYLFFTGKWKH
ncbi:lipocalin family protein [Phocaeicola coprocola]|uniref:lipocalin family protein n=1 Tax=Phocaeicola coprocola TaxID=310298 RepID=UPI0021D456CC|nr:lipocalin family protein [Phocaeicola coprocola]